MYLLDTDVLSEIRRRSPGDDAGRWLASQDTGVLFISVITVMEIERGIEQQRRRNPPFAAELEIWLRDLRTHTARVLPITTDIAARWGRMQIEHQRDDDDLAIAATAFEHGLTVVTRNTRHFALPGLAVVNPFKLS